MDAMNDNDFIPTFTHATERDVDLLLVEELYSSIDFVHWMAMNAGLTKPIWQWDVKHSKRRTRSRREIDIFIEILNSDKTRSALLIENKIDASEQPDQAESYRDELGVLAPDYQTTAMIIVCPEEYRDKYLEFTSKFDVCLTYQSIRNWFIQAESEAGNEAVLRYRLRAELFDQAIHKHRRGYTAIPDSVVGDFNAKYVKMLAELAPQIMPGNSMLKPANPRESTSMIFDQKKTLRGLQEDIRPSRFAHELGRGSDRRANYVAVTFAGWGAALPAIREVLVADTAGLDVEFTSKKPNQSRPNPGLVMSLPTAPVDNQGSFSEQQDLLADGIERAVFLRDWLLENRHVLVGWKSEVDKFLRSF
jgi:hypothetical protein